jgi:cell wall-associated NlpC family hydrolase
VDNSTKTDREKFLDAVVGKIGCPYVWGKSGPEQFDCCGLVEWAFAEIGRPFTTDFCSADMCRRFKDKEVLERDAEPGSLWFYSGTGDRKISHVMIMLRKWPDSTVGVLVGSRGGGPSTTSIDRSFGHRAFVDVVLSDYWHNNLVCIVDPFLP